jgi:hypothetical protein
MTVFFAFGRREPVIDVIDLMEDQQCRHLDSPIIPTASATRSRPVAHIALIRVAAD